MTLTISLLGIALMHLPDTAKTARKKPDTFLLKDERAWAGSGIGS